MKYNVYLICSDGERLRLVSNSDLFTACLVMENLNILYDFKGSEAHADIKEVTE